MYIDRIMFPVLTLGYGQRVGIWTLGCPRKCHKCSNPELQDINTKKGYFYSGYIRYDTAL